LLAQENEPKDEGIL